MNRPLPSGIANVFPIWDAFDSIDHGHNGVKVVNQGKRKMDGKDADPKHPSKMVSDHSYRVSPKNIRMSVYQKEIFATRYEPK